ncbi:MAG: energy-coupling factor transporter transmembrane protein EcfT [Aphanocapsa sp. GSE-SYN-MK-11-07L]|jgi:energy-coupling factor transport system permease protein|nr:energy-coupling factor transporter transmembrane protein EcfT [Aphanocapsa sp. GSE-SYN-MK-11-07L]
MDLLRSLPLGLYLEQPVTWLHRLDPRVKLVWLMTFLLSPLLADAKWRVALVGLLVLLTVLAGIPWRAFKRQLGWLLYFCILILGITALTADGLAIAYQSRLPADELAFAETGLSATPPQQSFFFWQRPRLPSASTPTLTNLPQPTPYRYILFQQGWVKITQRSLELGLRLSTLLFTLVFSTNLYLLTTPPEEITAGLENLMQPLKRLRVPVAEIVLTLTLALRFIPLVLEEVQNLARSVQTRAINWQKIGIKGAIAIWLMLADRLLENLFLRAEQVAGAMQVRGFTNPNRHRSQWSQLRLGRLDWLALGLVLSLWVIRLSLIGQA